MTDWLCAKISIPERLSDMRLDLLSGSLVEAGAQGIETRDRELPTVVIASFEAAPDVEARVDAVLAAAGLDQATLIVEEYEAVDWSTQWRQDFHALQFGRLWVVPTWLEPPEDAELVLRLDPGMAFGTGNHETTALCLERLIELAPFDALLDVGTGSGILGMGALLGGVSRVVGTDNDPDALVVGRENAEANGLSDRMRFTEDEPDAVGMFPVVVANILRDPLVKLAPKISQAVKSGGTLLLSGLLVEQLDGVAEAYEKHGFENRVDRTRGEWGLIELTKP